MKLAFAAQMKEMDRVAIEEWGIPSLDLMERAAEEIADVVEELTEVQESSAGREKRLFLPEATGEVSIGDCRRMWTKMPGKGEKRVAAFVGPGNNGGDGVGLGRRRVSGRGSGHSDARYGCHGAEISGSRPDASAVSHGYHRFM